MTDTAAVTGEQIAAKDDNIREAKEVMDALEAELVEARNLIEAIKNTNQKQYDAGYRHGITAAAIPAEHRLPVKPTMAEAIKLTEHVELPDDLRIPLHGLQADLNWLVARIIADPGEVDQFKESIRSRLSQIESASYRMTFSAALSNTGGVAIPAEPVAWQDRDDEMSAAILASHPVKSGRHDTYQQAMELVGNRHSKGSLVNLVNHLLILATPHSAALREALKLKQCPQCKGKKGFNDTTYDRTGEWVSCRPCDGTGEVFDTKAIRAALSPEGPPTKTD